MMTAQKPSNLMSKQWIVTNPHRQPPKESLPAHPMFDTWEKFIAPITPSDGDYEYFVEEAFRLHCAVTSFGAENVWLAHHFDEHAGQVQNLISREWKSLSEMEATGAGRYGALPGGVHESHSEVDDYCVWETFQKYAGRITGIGGFCDRADGDSTMEDVLTVIAESGAKAALLKRRKAKLPLLPVTLQSWTENPSVMDALDSDYGWSLIKDEGLSGVYLVQEVIPMRYEYRMFVINGELVTGAGCVEDFTPLDNEGEAFDSRMRDDRSLHVECPSPIESRPDLLQKYLTFAEKVVKELAVEHPEHDRYVLDVATSTNGETVIVEFNGESNAGFYACNPMLITEALNK